MTPSSLIDARIIGRLAVADRPVMLMEMERDCPVIRAALAEAKPRVLRRLKVLEARGRIIRQQGIASEGAIFPRAERAINHYSLPQS